MPILLTRQGSRSCHPLADMNSAASATLRPQSIVKLAQIALLALVLLGTMAKPLQANQNERQSLASLRLQAEEFVMSYPYESPYPVRFKLAQLDKRLNLKPCAERIGIDFTHINKTLGNTSLTLRCPGPVACQITLPVKISVFHDVIVNKTPLVKGQEIDSSRVEFKKMDVSRLHQGYYTALDELLELQSKRNLKAGSVLNPGNLVAQQLVKLGDQVTILFEMNGISIKSSGKALNSAHYGEVVKVKNTRSQRIVEGRVSAPGLVTVGF